MAVSNEKVIGKMIHELENAKAYQHNHEKMMKYIERVHLLCELMMEVETNEKVTQQKKEIEITPEEMKAMLGKQSVQKGVQKTTIDQEEANGSSIFDF